MSRELGSLTTTQRPEVDQDFGDSSCDLLRPVHVVEDSAASYTAGVSSRVLVASLRGRADDQRAGTPEHHRPRPRRIVDAFDLQAQGAVTREDPTPGCAADRPWRRRILRNARWGPRDDPASPDGAHLEEQLARSSSILAMVFACDGCDHGRVHAGLQQPQDRLGGVAPLEALRRDGDSAAIERWIGLVWLGRRVMGN